MDLALWKKRQSELKLNNDELADRAKISRRTLYRIFSGDANPTQKTVQAIERALGLETPAPVPAAPKGYDGIIAALSDGGENLSEEDVNEIIRFIKFKKNGN